MLFGDYGEDALTTAFSREVPPRLRQGLAEAPARWDTAAADALYHHLKDLLAGPCARKDEARETAPVLLVIDDLERILEEPQCGDEMVRVKERYAPMLRSVIEAFRDARTESALLLTSRYRFALADSRGRDLAEDLLDCPLPPMGEREQVRQLRAELTHAENQPKPERQAEVVRLGKGNPGVQSRLTRTAVEEPEATDAALEAMRRFLSDGAIPKDRDLGELFEQLALGAYVEALGDDERRLAAASALLELPVPAAILVDAGDTLGLSEPEKAVTRLSSLGLLDGFVDPREPEEPELMLNALARPLVGEIAAAEEKSVINAILPPLEQAWNADGFRSGTHALALFALADQCGTQGEILVRAGAHAAGWLYHIENNAKAVLAVSERALAEAERLSHPPAPGLIRLAAECATRIGDTERAGDLLSKALDLSDAEPVAQARIWAVWADHLVTKGQPDDALPWLEKALAAFAEARDVRERAVTMGQIADILQARGNLDEALRIRKEDEIPVYEKLGDVRSRAVTMGQIADILQARGNLDEALRILNDDLLPAFDKLGDVRSRAVTMGRIADILQARGNLDEALKIRNEEEIPVYEKLGDVRSRAVTMGQIADILQARGNLDEALRILNDDLLPAFDKLGDVRSRAVTMGKIADILQARGNLDEALRILNDDLLPAFDKLGDVRSRAVTMGKIADILQARGNLDKALKIRNEEEIPVYEKLGDVRERAVTMGKIADILQERGQLDKALEENNKALNTFRELGDSREIGASLWQIAQIELGRGDVQAAAPRVIEAYQRLDAMGALDGIAAVGVAHGQFLMAAGEREEGLRVLRRSVDGFRQLGHVGMAEQVEELILNLTEKN